MIKSILYVEDGSVDVDQLQEDLGEDVYVIVYRQGSCPPILTQPEKPLQSRLDSENVYLRNKIEQAKKKLNLTCDVKKSKKLLALLKDVFDELDSGVEVEE